MVAPTPANHGTTAVAPETSSAMPSTYTRAPVRRSATASTVAPNIGAAGVGVDAGGLARQANLPAIATGPVVSSTLATLVAP